MYGRGSACGPILLPEEGVDAFPHAGARSALNEEMFSPANIANGMCRGGPRIGWVNSRCYLIVQHTPHSVTCLCSTASTSSRPVSGRRAQSTHVAVSKKSASRLSPKVLVDEDSTPRAVAWVELVLSRDHLVKDEVRCRAPGPVVPDPDPHFT